jgi:hypothetical protein
MARRFSTGTPFFLLNLTLKMPNLWKNDWSFIMWRCFVMNLSENKCIPTQKKCSIHLDKEMSEFKSRQSITYVLIKSIASLKKLFSWFPFFNQKKPMWMVIVMINLLHIKWVLNRLNVRKNLANAVAYFCVMFWANCETFWTDENENESLKMWSQRQKKIVDKMLLWLPSKLRKKADRMPLVKVSLHI